ncbi:MAG: DUF1232 domain-containing protein [Candidatus Sericytochromatia bacterium]|nr:DUF1232 domain-containing protein [Candidatus Sericytochromatia bacterium]
MFNPAEVLSSPMFRACRDKAEALIGDRQQVAGLVANATAKLDRMEASRGPVGEAVRAGRVGVRMLQATLEGRYDKVPVKSLAAIAGAMLYFMQGDDLIDDDTPIIGYLDDAVVIAMALKVVQGDLDAFLAWEQGAAAASQA